MYLACHCYKAPSVFPLVCVRACAFACRYISTWFVYRLSSLLPNILSHSVGKEEGLESYIQICWMLMVCACVRACSFM